MISYNNPKKKSSDAVLQGVTIRAERRKTFFFRVPLILFFSFFLFGVCWVVVVYTLGRDEESTRLQRLLYVCREIKTGKEKRKEGRLKTHKMCTYIIIISKRVGKKKRNDDDDRHPPTERVAAEMLVTCQTSLVSLRPLAEKPKIKDNHQTLRASLQEEKKEELHTNAHRVFPLSSPIWPQFKMAA